MASPTLLASAAFSVAAALLYAFVGHRVGARAVSPAAWTAAQAFVAFWYALAGLSAFGAVTAFAGALGATDLALFVTVTHVELLLLTLAFGGLFYYLLYLFTGARRLLAPVAAAYAALYGALVFIIAAAGPAGVAVGRWSTSLVFARPPSGPVGTAFGLVLFVPEFVGAFAYFSLWFKLREPGPRFRVAVVSWSIIGWFLSSYLGGLAGLGGSDAWQVFTRVLGLLAALAVLSAYYPPSWMRRRYHLEAEPRGVAE